MVKQCLKNLRVYTKEKKNHQNKNIEMLLIPPKSAEEE